MTGKQKMRIAWTAMILVNIVVFAVLETYALSRGNPDDGLTLSRYVYDITQAWPLAIFLLGLLSGGLAVHFWWHWDPANPGDRRG